MFRPHLLICLLTMLSVGSLRGSAQDASNNITGMAAYKVEDLNARLEAGGDTTYVLNFWATWCAPCIKEMPYFDQLQEEYADRPLKVLLISVDAPTRAVKSLPAFMEKRAPQSEVLHLNEAKPHIYIDRIEPEWSGSVPATLIRQPFSGKKVFHEGEITFPELEALVIPLMN